MPLKESHERDHLIANGLYENLAVGDYEYVKYLGLHPSYIMNLLKKLNYKNNTFKIFELSKGTITRLS